MRVSVEPHEKVLARIDRAQPSRMRQLAAETNLDRTHGVTRLPDGQMVGYTVAIIRDDRYVANVGPWSLRGCAGIQIRADHEVELHRRCQMAIRGLAARVLNGRGLPWSASSDEGVA